MSDHTLLLISLGFAFFALFLVLAFRYAMNIRAHRRASAFDLEWELVPYNYEINWFQKPENLRPADLIDNDKELPSQPPKSKLALRRHHELRRKGFIPSVSNYKMVKKESKI